MGQFWQKDAAIVRARGSRSFPLLNQSLLAHVMKTQSTELPGVLLIEPHTFRDDRGYFLETWNRERYQQLGLPETMVQDNLSWSKRGVLRGLHFQQPVGQGKLIYVLSGQIYDVAVDVRVGSPTFGRWEGFELSRENGQQVYLPPGFAHGFCVLSATALVAYKCSDVYRPEYEIGVVWNDPKIGVRWPLASPLVSAKDAKLRRLDELPAGSLPRYEEDAAPAAARALAA
jgi:dTDP-4-dehydrorhamnose 3,5-epimerase